MFVAEHFEAVMVLMQLFHFGLCQVLNNGLRANVPLVQSLNRLQVSPWPVSGSGLRGRWHNLAATFLSVRSRAVSVYIFVESL